MSHETPLPVPPGFVVTVDAFRAFLAASGIEAEVDARLEDLLVDDPVAVRHASEALQSRIRNAPIPETVGVALTKAHRELASRVRGVRSVPGGEARLRARWRSPRGGRIVRRREEMIDDSRPGAADAVR